MGKQENKEAWGGGMSDLGLEMQAEERQESLKK